MEGITSFGDWVRRQRKVLDVSQAQLAAQVGCAVITIRKIEQGMRRPSRQMAELLAEALAVPAPQQDLFLRMARHEYIDVNIPPPSAMHTPPFPNAIDEASKPTHFVARQRELVQLKAHLTGAFNGSGRIVFIAGEAGYGKTTLMVEFARHALATYPDLIVVGGNCDAYGGAGEPYLPFREIMASLTGDIESPSRASLLSHEQIRRLWANLPHTAHALIDHDPDLIEVFVSGTDLLQRTMPSAGDSLRAQLQALMQRKVPPGNLRQRQISEQYVQVLRALTNRQPLLLILDDLQWVDHASAGLLLYMARRLAGSRLLLLGAYRLSEVEASCFGEEQNEAHPLLPVLEEIKRHYGDVEIDLGKQVPQAARAFVDALLDSEPNQLAETFRAALYQRTEGHPLFTVELLRDMQERGDLVRDGEGRWIEGGVVDWEALPTRVEVVINQRISRLPAFLQEALKVASVEGETFTAEVVAHILGVENWQMVKHFSSVVDRQHHLITSKGTQRLRNQLLSRYRFGHILFQVYLYDTLDTAERAYLHEAVGYTLEQLAAGQTEIVAVQLAHHFQAAGLVAKAIDYLHQAGERAVALSADQEAIAHLTRALALLEEQPNTLERARLELRLQTDLGVSLKATKGFAAPEVERAYLRAQALCEQVGDTRQWTAMLWGLHSVYTVRGEQPMARQLAQQCLRLVPAQDDPVLYLTAHSALGMNLGHLGQLSLGRAHVEQAIAAYSTQHHRAYVFLAGLDLGVFSFVHLAHILWYLGYPDQALEQGQKAVTLAHSLSHPFSQAAALSYMALLYQLRRDWYAVQTTAEAAAQLCIEQDFPYYLAWSTLLQGWVLTERGQLEQGIVQMEQSLADLQAMGTGLRRPYYLSLLAEAYGKAGRMADGLRLQESGVAQAQEQEQHMYEAELYRVRGELLRTQGTADEAVEKCFYQAITLAQQQEAKSLELRAATSLARLWQSQGKYVEARRTLAGVVDWFSEGFETPDLQEARTLLDALT